MSNFLLMGVGQYNKTVSQTVASIITTPLQFFENFPGKNGVIIATSSQTLSFHAVNIPLSLSFGYPVIYMSRGGAVVEATATRSISFGLYSLTGSTLSLANSASRSVTIDLNGGFVSWLSMITSATQNITPGTWYFGINFSEAGGGGLSVLGNSSINPANAVPGAFLRGRVTASTGAMPASIATSALDITGADAMRQPYIIITA